MQHMWSEMLLNMEQWANQLLQTKKPTAMRTCVFVLVSVISCLHVARMRAQTSARFGPELGLSISRFAESGTGGSLNPGDIWTETKEPVYGPLVGCGAEFNLLKYVYLKAAIQFQQSGMRYHFHRERDHVVYGNYTTDRWQEQRFWKLCAPIALGLTIQLGKFQPALFAGWRPDFFVGGEHYEKEVIDYTKGEEDYWHETRFNPFEPTRTGSNAKRFQSQRLYGISASYGPHLAVSLVIHTGHNVFYTEDGQSDTLYGFKNNDYVMSLAWYFSHSVKRKAYIITFPEW